MKIRVRGPTGQETHSLPDSATLGDLQNAIVKQTSLQSFDIKYGYPPRPLDLGRFDEGTKLSELEVRLNGEQLIVSKSHQTPSEPALASVRQEATTPKSSTNNGLGLTQKTTPPKQPSAFSSDDSAKFSPAGLPKSQKPLSLTRSQSSKEMDPPELPVPSHGATMVLRIMPDDNSCLFRAFNTAYLNDMDNMVELRSIIAQYIQANPGTYSEAVLEKKPDDYCRWIQESESWGGSIELLIFSQHFDIEICSIDVQTLRVDRYNEGMKKRCILVYSGIHYDTIALSPSAKPHHHATASPEYDTKVFDTSDKKVLQAAVTLCTVLKDKHYYTDTAGFKLRCKDCDTKMKGQKAATEHYDETGHMNFEEIKQSSK